MVFFPTFFFGNIGQGNVFLRYSRTKKLLFYVIKIRSSKSRKIDIFSKRLTHGFGPKLALFTTLFIRQYRPGKCLLRDFRTKKRFSRLKKQEVLKVKKLTFLKRG